MKKRLVSLLVAVVMISSVFSLSVAAEDVALERSMDSSYYWVFGYHIDTSVHADAYYASAYINCGEVEAGREPLGVTACAYIKNRVDDLEWSMTNLSSASVDVTLGELQGANDYPTERSYAYAWLGSYEMDRTEYFGAIHE